MRALFYAHINSETWREGLLKPHTNAEANDGGERAVGYGRGYEDGQGSEWRRSAFLWEGRRKIDIGQVDNRERAEREGVFRIRDRRNEVCMCQRSIPLIR